MVARTHQDPVKPRNGTVDQRCVTCGKAACFGLTFPLALPDQWFCPAHKPEDYYRRRA